MPFRPAHRIALPIPIIDPPTKRTCAVCGEPPCLTCGGWPCWHLIEPPEHPGGPEPGHCTCPEQLEVTIDPAVVAPLIEQAVRALVHPTPVEQPALPAPAETDPDRF